MKFSSYSPFHFFVLTRSVQWANSDRYLEMGRRGGGGGNWGFGVVVEMWYDALLENNLEFCL